MDVYYITFALFPARSAHTLHIMKLCEAFADNGHAVTLVIPNHNDKRFAANIEQGIHDLHGFYNVKKNFKIIEISLLPYRGWKYFFPYKALKYIQNYNKAIVYTRHTEIATVSALSGVKTFVEYHQADINGRPIQAFYSKFLYRSKNLHKIVVVSNGLKNALIKAGFKAHELIVIRNGSNYPSSTERITLSSTSKISVGYIGSLYNGKGMELILKIAPRLPHIFFHVIGGIQHDITEWQNQAKALQLPNIIFHGFIPQNNLSGYINALDICLLPNQKNVSFLGGAPINISDYTSPLKMFEYMAHAKAIIASNLTVIKEVLNFNNAILCEPENTQQWVDAINKLSNDADLRERLGKQAFSDFEENYTWKKRANRIIDSLINPIIF